jgi:ABC-type lipoprotein export system ATPase subunit
MVVVSSLKYRYGSDISLSFPDFSVEKGKTCLLLGNSGSGKTTLLHLMGGLLKIQQGKVEIASQDISLLSEPQLDRFRGKHMGFIFQRNHLISALFINGTFSCQYETGRKQGG